MNLLYEAALELQQFLESQKWRFCIIGGLAVVRWGQPRATQDVDVSLFASFGSEPEYVETLLKSFSGRLPDTRQFALESRVVLAKASNGVALDIALAAFPYEEQVIGRATSFEFIQGVNLVTASAEDIVVLKSFAGRHQDWSDVDGIVVRRMGQFDWDYALQQLKMLCELQSDDRALRRLQSLRARTNGAD